MRRSLLVLLLVCFAGLAGCVGDGIDEAPGDDLIGDGDESGVDANDSGLDADLGLGEGEGGAPPGGDLELHHLDVGQADATLVITPANETVLIDTGDWRQNGSDVIASLEALGVERIDHLIATHGHADHIGGHAAVIEWAETEGDGVGAAYDSGIAHTSATYERYLDAVEDHDVELFVVEEGDELPLENRQVEALFVNPAADDDHGDEDVHVNSVSLVIRYGEFSYVTTGDAETRTEERMVAEWGDALDSDVYQAGHHGSNTSSGEAWLDAVSPEIAIISSDYESQYGHPHDEILEAFADRGIETYWTAVHGDVFVVTDGQSIDVRTEEAFSTDAADLLEEKASIGDRTASPVPLMAMGPQPAPA